MLSDVLLSSTGFNHLRPLLGGGRAGQRGRRHHVHPCRLLQHHGAGRRHHGDFARRRQDRLGGSERHRLPRRFVAVRRGGNPGASRPSQSDGASNVGGVSYAARRVRRNAGVRSIKTDRLFIHEPIDKPFEKILDFK